MKTKNISLSVKFILTSALFLIPAVSPIYFMLKELRVGVDFAKREMVGLDALKPMHELYTLVGRYRIGVSSDKDFVRGELDSKGDALIARLETVFANSKEWLRLDSDSLKGRNKDHLALVNLKAQWRQVKEAKSVADLTGALNNLNNSVKDFFSYVGDTSNLVLDPDLDSFYLMDVVVYAIPGMSGNFQDWIQGFVDKTRVVSNSDLESILIASKVKDGLARTEGSISTALLEDARFFGPNDSLQTDVKTNLKQFSSEFLLIYDQLRAKVGSPLSTSDFNAMGVYFDLETRLWLSAEASLRELLQARVDDISRRRTNSLLVIFLSLLFAGCCGFLLQRSVIVPIRSVMGTLTEISHAIRSSSVKLSGSSQASASAAIEEAASIQESVSAMSEMTSMLAQTSLHTQNTHELSRQVQELTVSGGEKMKNMSRAMNDISSVNKRLGDIQQLIENISLKTNIINDIVSKTQLLAFNASIEAARAGQQGRGFSVVASEVGTLANISGKAASEIATLLNESRVQVSSIVESTSLIVSQGQNVCVDALDSFGQISKQIEIIVEKVEQINEATKQQQIGVKQTSRALDQLDAATSVNQEHSRATMLLAGELSHLGENLFNVGMATNLLILGSDSSSK